MPNVVPFNTALIDTGLRVAETATVPVSTTAPPAPTSAVAPVFLGATRRIGFFSLNGGSGRTTLATEIACLLAARGRHRAGPEDADRPLRVALLDLDLRSPNVAVRLGMPQPTLLDYLVDADDPAALDRCMVVHHSGLRALLGPPKPLTAATTTLEPARVAEIVHRLESDGTHFLVCDLSADLGAVTTWTLSAMHDIYVVIRPTASGVQDAYRSTEALRRLGLGPKLRYVVNRARTQLDLDEVMGDLGGRVVASIPDDPRVEHAENNHSILCIDGSGPAATAITSLAEHIYPALRVARPRSRFAIFGRRRVG
jgi:MinD-like ATPase involved in chromosome partitioning or flagellar assembly